jgi:SnoaL-like domain
MDERIDIADCVARVGLLVDTRNWRELTELFAPEVRLDYTSLFGGEAQMLTREDMVAGWTAFVPGFTRTEHLIGAPVITIAGQTARAVAPVVAWHTLDEPPLGKDNTWLVGGRYEFWLLRLDGWWRINALTLAAAWAQGNLDLPRIVTERMQRR